MKTYTYLLFCLCLLLAGCQLLPEEENTPAVVPERATMQDRGPGRKLQNPYSVTNMRRAQANVRARMSPQERGNAQALIIQATHLYVRFLPADSLEMERLLYEEDLELFTYPLDYQLDYEGEFYYHDPTIPDDRPTWQYTVVPVGYAFPDIQVETLEELYLLEEGTYANASTLPQAATDDCYNKTVLNESFRITNNHDEVVATDDCVGGGTGGSGGTGGGSGTGGGEGSNCSTCPRGRILVENIVNGPIVIDGRRYDGVPDVKVRARKWFNIQRAYTDTNGGFLIDHTFGGNREVHMSIVYKNDNAFIKPATIGFGPAMVNGPKTSAYWEYRSNTGRESYLWGAIMRGVFDYHYVYAPMFDIGRPAQKLKIKACSNNDCGLATMLHQDPPIGGVGKWLFSDIRIGSRDDFFQSIYATTIHELGHAAHYEIAGDWNDTQNAAMAFTSQLVAEAWASGINDQTYSIKFPGLNQYYWGSCEDNQRLRFQRMIDDGYPRILVRDLMDNVNEYDPNNDNCDDLNDWVVGISLHDIYYSLRDTEGSLFGRNSMEKWRDNIIERNPNQEMQLNTYFEPWTQ